MHIKQYNRQKLKTVVPILREVDEIMNPQKEVKAVDYDKQGNTVINAKIMRECDVKDVKPCYKMITAEQLKLLKNT